MHPRTELDWRQMAQVCWSNVDLQVDRTLWTRFPLELSADDIVVPHLFDARPYRADDAEDAVYTLPVSGRFAIVGGRGPHHLAFLSQEVAPRIAAKGLEVAIVDFDHATFRRVGGNGSLPIEDLADAVNGWTSAPIVPPDAFDEVGRTYELADAFAPPREADVAAVAAHPARLWEAFFWRGHSGRYELIGGEVPLVGDLLSAAGAEATRRQCVADAERLTGESPVTQDGWTTVGRFRIRRLDELVEIRVRLERGDRRITFMPRDSTPDDEALPTLPGVLMAGGENGKTELWGGWTWATATTRSRQESRGLAADLAETLARWTEAPVEVSDAEDFMLPDTPDSRFLIHHDAQWLRVYVPLHREHQLPWKIADGHFRLRSTRASAA